MIFINVRSAYEIVKRLKEKNANDLPDILQAGVKQSDRKKERTNTQSFSRQF